MRRTRVLVSSDANNFNNIFTSGDIVEKTLTDSDLKTTGNRNARTDDSTRTSIVRKMRERRRCGRLTMEARRTHVAGGADCGGAAVGGLRGDGRTGQGGGGGGRGRREGGDGGAGGRRGGGGEAGSGGGGAAATGGGGGREREQHRGGVRAERVARGGRGCYH
eukprot:1195752-Prorocentrum_minimum.AAC.6